MHIVECITREKQYMLNNIFLKFSEFAMLGKDKHPFSNEYGAAAEAILTEFTTNEDLVNTPIEELVELINTKSRGGSLIRRKRPGSYRLLPETTIDWTKVSMIP